MLGSDVTEQVASPPNDRRAGRHAATKAEILESAWAIARRDGLAALSMRELAASVGMRAPSLYQYFSSKLAIYDAMFGQGMGEALATITGAIEARKGLDALRESGRAIVEFATNDRVRAQLLFLRTIPEFEPSPEAYAPALEMSGRVQSLIEELGIIDPDAMDLWTALMSGLTNQQLANDPGGTRWIGLVDRTVDMFLNEVAPHCRSPKAPRKTAREEF